MLVLLRSRFPNWCEWHSAATSFVRGPDIRCCAVSLRRLRILRSSRLSYLSCLNSVRAPVTMGDRRHQLCPCRNYRISWASPTTQTTCIIWRPNEAWTFSSWSLVTHLTLDVTDCRRGSWSWEDNAHSDDVSRWKANEAPQW